MTRGATRVVAERAPALPPDASPDLRFEFDGRRAQRPAPRPRSDDSIKQAIIRWLNEEL